jgi:two-component system KDP operon response regulator KdpE
MSQQSVDILIIDDELQIRRFLKVALEPHGYRIIEATDGNSGLALAAQLLPDLIILDLGLPDIDGQEVLKRLREWYQKPIIILSVKNDEENIIAALDNGADDYLRKPFSLGELLARIRVCQRHSETKAAEPVFERGDLKVDFAARRVTIRGVDVKLTGTEYDLLKILVHNEGKVLTHSYILKEIWGPNAARNTQYLRVYIGHLRQKLERDPNRPEVILTESGVGYRINL